MAYWLSEAIDLLAPGSFAGLLAAGHEVAVFHRGQTSAALPPSTRTFVGDRRRLAHHAEDLAASPPM